MKPVQSAQSMRVIPVMDLMAVPGWNSNDWLQGTQAGMRVVMLVSHYLRLVLLSVFLFYGSVMSQMHH